MALVDYTRHIELYIIYCYRTNPCAFSIGTHIDTRVINECDMVIINNDRG